MLGVFFLWFFLPQLKQKILKSLAKLTSTPLSSLTHYPFSSSPHQPFFTSYPNTRHLERLKNSLNKMVFSCLHSFSLISRQNTCAFSRQLSFSLFSERLIPPDRLPGNLAPLTFLVTAIQRVPLSLWAHSAVFFMFVLHLLAPKRPSEYLSDEHIRGRWHKCWPQFLNLMNQSRFSK